MESFIAELSSFFRWLLVSTMQVSVLVCLIFAIKAVIRRRLAVRWHYWLWLLMLVRMVSPWAPESSFSVFTLTSQAQRAVVPEHIVKAAAKLNPNIEIRNPKQIQTTKTQMTETKIPAAARLPDTTPTKLISAQAPVGTSVLSLEVIDVLSLVWFTVALALVIFALVCNFRLWRIVKSQRPLTEEKILDLLEDCKAEMGVQTILGVIVTDKVKSPALFGVVRPRLLLPEGIIKTLNTKQLRYVFLHELAHLKRHDIYLGWLMVVLQILHWFNPLVWLAFARMRADRELACDGLVLSTMDTGQSQAYGQTLVNLFKGFSRPRFVPGIAGILENKSLLKRRITMIARFKKGSYGWSALAVVLLAVLACVALTNARAASQTESKEPITLAKEFVELLVEGQFSKATENFDATMEKSLPADKLAETWRSTTGQAGLFKQQLGVREEKFLGSDIVLVTCEFEKGPLDVKVVYNSQREVSGLWFLPVPEDVLKSYQEQPAEKAKEMVPSRRRAGLSAPQVVSTNPVALSNDVSPDLTEITVTFDQPMMNLSWSWVGGGETFPETTGQPRYDREKTTCSFPVKLEPGKFYWVGINSPRFKNFQTDMGVPAVPYAILFATKDKEGNPTPIPENFIEEAKEINSRSGAVQPVESIKSSEPRTRGRGKRVELSYDDGSSDDRESIAGGGHAVIFEAPAEGCILKAVRIYGSRYGHPGAPNEDFHIWLCDEEFNVIEDFSFPYARFTRGNPRWVTLRVDDIEVPSTFVICAGFNPEQTKGVYVHYDDSGSGNSFIALPGQDRRVFNRGEWMIHAVVQQGGGRPRTVVKSGAEDGQSLLGKWESVDFVQKAEDFSPGQRIWQGRLFLESIDFFKDGRTSNHMMPQWEKEWILHQNGQTKERYIIKEIDETTYLFLPWLSGDVTERGQKPSYYVLKKAGDTTKADKMAAENLTAEGWQLWGQRQMVEAEAKFKEAIAKDPQAEGAYQGLGWAQLNQGKRLNAKDSFEKCIAINPKNSAALNGLGWIAHGQGDKDEAIAWWEKAVEVSNGQATASLNGLTQVYMELEEYDKAIKYYNMWLTVEPGNVEVRAGLEKAQAAIKNK